MIPGSSNLPAGWRLSAISDVTVHARQRDPSKSPNDKFTYVDVSSVDNQLCRIADTSELLGAHAPSRARKEIREKDVLFATVRPTLRRIALVPAALDKQIASTGYCVLRSNVEIVSPEYLYYCVRTDSFVDAIGKLQRGASYPAVRDSDVRNARIPLPPLDEQRKIAAVLGVVQKAIEEQERLIALTTELKKTLLHQLFTHGLRSEPKKQTEIGLVPESWKIKKLGDFCVLQRGFDIVKKHQRSGTIPVVSSGGVASYHNTAKVKGPGVVIGRKGTLGKVHYIEQDFWPHDTTLWVKDFRGNNPRFTAYLLEALRLERFDSGVSNPTLNRNTVHGELIAVPEFDEQIEISRSLAMADQRIALHVRRRDFEKELFSVLLHQLMTATIRLGDNNLQRKIA